MAQSNGVPHAAVPREAAFIVAYGVSKNGKTSDAVYSFPQAIFVAAPGALKPAMHVVGYVPKSVDLATIGDATALLRELMTVASARRPGTLVVDDFSLLSERTVTMLEQKYRGHKNKYAVWDAVRDTLLDFRDTARHAGIHVVLNAHEGAPTTKNGAFIRGGPKLPGMMMSDLPAACDVVLRAGIDETRMGPWPGVYRCNPLDQTYVTGDRHGVAYDKCPMNLGEILRAAGYVLPRAPGMEWTEAVVAALADEMAGADAAASVATLRANVEPLQRKASQAGAAQPDLQVRWIFRDALDRAAIRKARSSPLAAFGI